MSTLSAGSVADNATKHVLVHVLPFWGHWKPVVTLAVLILQLRHDVVVHLLVTAAYHDRISAELVRVARLRDALEAVKRGVQVINISADPSEPFSALEGFVAAVSLRPQLNLAIVDALSAKYSIDPIRSINIPGFIIYTSTVTSFLRQIGPRSLGGEFGDLDDYKPEDSKLPRHGGEGGIVRVPGVPPMYDYEWFPQEAPPVHDAVHSHLFRTAIQYLSKTAGTLVLSNSIFDTEAVQAAKTWHKEEGRAFYAVGPAHTVNVAGESSAKEEIDSEEFLDRVLKQHGERSVIYISFGTLFWPSDEGHLWTLLDTLYDKQTPFILAHNRPISQERRSRYEKQGRAMIRPWVQQEKVLMHAAVGWFVTHGGWNSLQEALLHGIPMIIWPLVVDQPTNAAVAARIHRIAFELINVRTGHKGTSIPYHIGVVGGKTEFDAQGVQNEVLQLLERMRSDEGEEVRRNVIELGFKMRMCGESGEARQDLRDFLGTNL